MKYLHAGAFVVPRLSQKWKVVPLVAPMRIESAPFLPHSLSTQLAATNLPIAVVTSVAPSKGFFQLLAAFIAGGLFFSTALAGVAAVAAIGKENLSLLGRITQLVWRKVWKVFVLGLKETRSVIRMDGKWSFRRAWERLRATILETRQIATEGVTALRDEAQLYYGAVGGPGLLPIQYALDRLMPYTCAIILKDALAEALSNVRNDNIRGAKLKEFDVGSTAPQLKGARIYDLKDDALAYDIDVEWKSELYAKINLVTKRIGIKIPATVKNVDFKGTVRVEVVPFLKEPPGYGAILFSLPNPPKLGIDVAVAGGEITKVPWLRSELLGELQKSIEQELLWPKRVVVPTSDKVPKDTLKELLMTDPLLKAEQRLAEQPILKEYMRQPDKKSLRKMLKVMVGAE